MDRLVFVNGELLAGAVVGVRKPKAFGFAFREDDEGGCTPTPANAAFLPSAGFAGGNPNENGDAGFGTALADAEADWIPKKFGTLTSGDLVVAG